MAYTTIDNPELYFQTKLYTGDASATAHTLDGSENMQPTLAWFKSRSRADNSRIVDALRTTNSLKSNTNAGEVDSASDGFTSLDADGFTLNGSGGGGEFNAASGTYVTYCWKGGTTSGIVTTGADITPSTYSFNQTAGISIIKYTGNSSTDQQIAHGLGAVPHVIICKVMDADNPQSWNIYHHKNTAAPETDYLVLDTNAATADAVARWQDTAPTSVLFTVGDAGAVNQTGDSIISYIFSEKQGFSKMGSYIGNGNADGVFVYTGFRPAFLMAKCSSTTSGGAGNWYIFDGKRAGYNFANYSIKANDTDAEATSTYLELLSNGFKIRNAAADLNGSGNTYIYAAFAEAPFVNSNGVPCNAR